MAKVGIQDRRSLGPAGEAVAGGTGQEGAVLGNHEFDGTVDGHVDGFEEIYSTLYVPGCPELLLTHVPLREVPDGCVNVHGHAHRWVPSETRHINVVGEQTRYRPTSLTAVRRLAASLVRGVRLPGRTTAQQLTHAAGAVAAGGVARD